MCHVSEEGVFFYVIFMFKSHQASSMNNISHEPLTSLESHGCVRCVNS